MANTTDLAHRLAKRQKITAKKAAEIIIDILDEFVLVLEQKEHLKLRGFGTLQPVERAARRSYMINKGTTGEMPSTCSVRFRPSPLLIMRLARNKKKTADG